MTMREGVAWGLAVTGLAAAGAFGWEARRMSDRAAALERETAVRTKAREAEAAEASKALEAARLEGTRLTAEAEEALGSRKAAEEKLAALEAQARAEPPAAAPAKKKRGGMGPMMAMARKAMEDPAMKAQMRQGMKAQVEAMYGDLLKELGLEGEARDRMVEALLDRMMGQMEVGMLLADAEVGEDEILRRQDEAYAQADAALAGLLDGAQQARLEAYDRELPDRMLARQADQELAPLKLNAAQQERVRVILIEEQKGIQARMEAGFGGMGGPGGSGRTASRMTAEEIRKAREMMQGNGLDTQGLLKSMAESRERTLARAQPLLTPDQYAAFRKQQEAQAQMMEMGLKMMQSMGGE